MLSSLYGRLMYVALLVGVLSTWLGLVGCGGGESTTANPAASPPTCSSGEALLGKDVNKWKNFRVMDTHMHITNWAEINYTYASTSKNNRDWTLTAYLLDSFYAAFPMPDTPTESDSCFFMMGLIGLPHSEQLYQATWSQRVADSITQGPKMCGIVTTIKFEEDLKGDINDFKAFLDKVEAEVPLNKGFRCTFTQLEDETTLPAFRELAERGKTFDVFTGSYDAAKDEWSTSLSKLQDALWLAESVPSLNIIIDHMGFPGVPGAAAPDFQEWSDGMKKLVDTQNVNVKVSGGTQGLGVIRPYFKFLVDNFGYDRLIWSSNWFNIKFEEGFYSYNSWAAAVAQFMIEMEASDDDVKKILYDTAARVYKASGSSDSRIVV